MKILVVTNLYPPHHIGGYELGCLDVVENLQLRGHEIHVLTSDYQADTRVPEERGIERSLNLVRSSEDGHHGKLREIRLYLRAVRRWKPDAIYFWNLAGLSYWLPVVAGLLGHRIAFFLSDTNFVAWRVGALLFRWAPPLSEALPARILRSLFGGHFLLEGWPVIRNQPCHFASRFLMEYGQRAGIVTAAQTSRVVHWGIDRIRFPMNPARDSAIRRLLYVGQLIPQKGVHTAVIAFAIVAREFGLDAMSLSVVGGGLDPDYERSLQELAVQHGVSARVHFLGKIPRADLPRVYQEHDLLIFPSEWEEPFAITPLEAMASGVVVVGTMTGGSGEIFRDGVTARTFVAGDAQDCARAICELCVDHELQNRIREEAGREVGEHHTLPQMTATIEDGLRSLP